jgi:hypothetical protein
MNLPSIPKPSPSLPDLKRAVDELIDRERATEITESATIQVQHNPGGTSIEVKPSFGGGSESRPVWL